MAITRISQSTVKEGLEKFNSFYGGFTPVFGDFDSIATVTVGSGGATSIEFNGIPQDYSHLQIRMIGRSTRSATDDYIGLRMNRVLSSSYAYHAILGDGSSAKAQAGTSQTFIDVERLSAATALSNGFGAAIINILDYSSSSKNKTISAIGGYNNNSTQTINCGFSSGFLASTSAITSITLLAQSGTSNFSEYSTAALYGVKTP